MYRPVVGVDRCVACTLDVEIVCNGYGHAINSQILLALGTCLVVAAREYPVR